ncbi:MAG: hypothetical protein WBL31_03285 [Ilumatobacteraceae bacterium]
MDTADRSAGVSWLRSVEAEVLLSAISALRSGGFLTEAEYQAKRQRLAAQL